MVKALIASLGFDERHVVRSLLSMGMGGVGEICLLRPRWSMDERTERAFNEIKKIAGLAGIGVDRVYLYEVSIEDFWTAVSEIIELINRLYTRGYDEIIISLGGGLRALVIEAYTATLLVHEEIAKKIVIRIDLEARNLSITFRRNEIPLCKKLDADEARVIEKLLEKPEYTLTQLSKELGIPKTTLWKILNRLVKKNLVIKQDNKYIPTRQSKILTIINKME